MSDSRCKGGAKDKGYYKANVTSQIPEMLNNMHHQPPGHKEAPTLAVRTDQWADN